MGHGFSGFLKGAQAYHCWLRLGIYPAIRLGKNDYVKNTTGVGMTQDDVMQLASQTMWVTILLGGPLLLSALAVGLLVGMFQAATQINEMTLSFIPKLAILVVALLIFGPWMLSTIVDFTQTLIHEIPARIG